MAKRVNAKKRTSEHAAVSSTADATTSGAMEQRVVAFAEQLGRIVGTVQARAEGWMDRDALSQQIASVRDSAAGLLEQLAGDAAEPTEKEPAVTPKSMQGRSGGVVDAPGKKHRKAPPADNRGKTVSRQAARLRAGKMMVQTKRSRGRG
jgi:hypothetical protein